MLHGAAALLMLESAVALLMLEIAGALLMLEIAGALLMLESAGALLMLELAVVALGLPPIPRTPSTGSSFETPTASFKPSAKLAGLQGRKGPPPMPVPLAAVAHDVGLLGVRVFQLPPSEVANVIAAALST